MRVRVGEKVINFPDTMSEDEVKAELRKKFTKKEKEEVKNEVVKEIIKEVPKIIEKEVIKEKIVKVPKIKEIHTEQSLAPVMLETLDAIKSMMSRPPVEVREITTNPEFVIEGPREIKKWTCEITERDQFNNISSVEFIPEYE